MAKRPSETPTLDALLESKESVLLKKIPKIMEGAIQVTVTTAEPEIKELNDLVNITCKTATTWKEFFNEHAPATVIHQSLYEVKSSRGKIIASLDQRLEQYLAFSKRIPKLLTVRVVRTVYSNIQVVSSFQTVRAHTFRVQAVPEPVAPQQSVSVSGTNYGTITRVPLPLIVGNNPEILMERLMNACNEADGIVKENSHPEVVDLETQEQPDEGSSKGSFIPFDLKKISDNFCARIYQLPRIQPFRTRSDLANAIGNNVVAEPDVLEISVSPAFSNASTQSNSSAAKEDGDDNENDDGSTPMQVDPKEM